MAIHLSSSAAELPGIGAKGFKDLKAMGISTVQDFLLAVPFRYDDFSQVRKIADVRVGVPVTIVGTITAIKSRPAKNRHMVIVDAVLEDETGSLPIVWFNQAYLMNTIRPGTAISVSGTVDFRFNRSMANPVHESPGRNLLTGRIVPVYRLSGSLKMNRMRSAMNIALSAVHEFDEWLPEEILQKESFVDLPTALSSIHFPQTQKDLDRAIDRLKFEELFLHQMMFAQVRRDRAIRSAHPIAIDEEALKQFVMTLPFELTSAQRLAAWEIVQDLAKPHPMNRLLQGDVGSGKTVVAAIAASRVLSEGRLVVYLAPTEILAAQQHAVFQKLFPDHSVALFTRSQKQIGHESIKKEKLIEQIRDGEIRCVIGTHAVLQETVDLPNLAFVIVDEQHRFGVAQRHALLEKNPDHAPHLLSMTATPIPRSLALTVYGDLDVSIINQLPKGRKAIGTAVVAQSDREGMWQHVKDQVEQGRQAYVVCPLIDPSDALGARSVTELSVLLKKGALKGLRIEMLHGKLKADEKQAVMQSFKDGAIDVLVSTTVIEVGVDVPNATVMVVSGAERFGLAQLHQLRGRVGRSDLASYCYLLPDAVTQIGLERLRLLEQTQNGFKLAEKDLQLRGAGNVFGSAQSGFPDFQFATPADVEIMKKARDETMLLLGTDPELARHPLVAQRVKNSFDAVHLE